MYLKSLIKETIDCVKQDLPEVTEESLYSKACLYLFDNALFLVANWFDEQVGDFFVEEGETLLKERLAFFLIHQNDSPAEKEKLLLQMIRESFPETADAMDRFGGVWEWNGQGEGRCQALDFLAVHLDMEVFQMNDTQLVGLANKMMSQTTCCAANYFADFALWQKETSGNTNYTADLYIVSRGVRTTTMAYSLEQIVKLHYFCFNKEYLEENGLYSKAAGNLETAHCLLYLSTHLICALRDTDLARLPHPKLPEEPAALLGRIAKGTFTEEEARKVTRSMMESLDRIPIVPNKTRRHKNIPEIFLRIIPDMEDHFGILFAICECYCQLEEKGKDVPLFKAVKQLSAIRKTLGKEVADVFEGRGACPTAFSKSFMQLLGIMGSQSGELDGPGNAVFALGIASRVRSHKGGYGTFASSTFVYLKDCAMGTLDPETVLSECFKRGVMSCHLGHFLSLITNKEYEQLNFTQQTMLIHGLGLTALEAEKAMDIYKQAMGRAEDHLQEILSHLDPDERYEAVKAAMGKLFTRMASGKDEDVLCFVAALEKPCPYPGLRTCLSCPYRIDTRATLYHAVRELRRCRKLRDQARTEGERMKYELLSENYIIPLLAQASMAALEMFGEEAQAEVDGIIILALEDDPEADDNEEDV